MRPRHILMTVDAVGGVWRYGVDLCAGLNAAGVRVLLVCLGPAPSATDDVDRLPATRLLVLDAPLDWMAAGPAELDGVPRRIAELAALHGVDLLHLNLPSQAAGLPGGRPVVVVSHSCLPTWWAAMRQAPLPAEWAWQAALNAQGLAEAHAVLAPSHSHATALRAAYGLRRAVQVVPNAAPPRHGPANAGEPFVFAAGRWWDEGKNAALLDAAAALTTWPVLAAGAGQGGSGQGFAFRHARPLGALPHAETLALMRRAAIVASPSLYEPFGLAALEAAQAGAALVLADIPTYREFWDGAARFADPRDPAAFAAAIDALAADPAARAAQAAEAARRAAALSSRRQVAAMLEAYAAAAATALQPDLAG